MSRARLLLTLLTVIAAIAAAVVFGSGVLHKPQPARTRSPACLPDAQDHTAKLEGLPLFVSPAPASATASPYTQISFLGLPPRQIREVSVVGQRSGTHTGHLRGYHQGDGVSFLPDHHFLDGERVDVRAVIGASAQGKKVAFSFRVDTPYPTLGVAEFPNPTAAAADYESFHTLPGVQAPILTVTRPDRDPTAGDIFTTNGPGPGKYGPLIYTPQGRLVWFEQLPHGASAVNLNVQSYEGHPDLTFWQGKVLSLGFGQGEDIVMNSHYQTVARVTGGNGLQADLHDFRLAPGGIAYITAYNPILCDLSAAGGASDGSIVDTAIQEIDIATGLVRWEWHSLDHIGVSESQTAASTNTAPWDYLHLNSIDLEPDGDLLLSARSTWAAYQLERGTGRILWRLGGSKSSFKLGPGTATAWQHDGRMLPNGEITFFDNGSNPPVHSQSRALRIALDPATRKASLRSVYTHPGPLLSVSQGNAQTLSDGNTVVGYGSVPQISEYDRHGSLLFDAHLALGMDSYRDLRFPWKGRPLSPPTVHANLNSTDEETILYMSWNGSTEVASWRVLAGRRRQSLTPQITTPTSGFESTAILPARWTFVAVQALDSTGRVLSTSQPTPVASYVSSFPGAGSSG
jgi:hypothetical protein